MHDAGDFCTCDIQVLLSLHSHKCNNADGIGNAAKTLPPDLMTSCPILVLEPQWHTVSTCWLKPASDAVNLEPIDEYQGKFMRRPFMSWEQSCQKAKSGSLPDFRRPSDAALLYPSSIYIAS